MAFIAKDPHAGIGQEVANGQCVSLCQAYHGVPHTSRLRRGARVCDAVDVPRGTIVATFGEQSGRYENHTDGSSHMAVLIEKRPDGSILVVDQWSGQPVHERVIRAKGGHGTASNDADRFYVVEIDTDADVSETIPSSDMSRADVMAWQVALNSYGANIEPDGMWGPRTKMALEDYQRQNGLPVTGDFNRATWSKLFPPD